MEIEKGTDVGRQVYVETGHWKGARGVVVHLDAETIVIELENGEQVVACFTQKAVLPETDHREIGS